MNERVAPPFIWSIEDNAKDTTKDYNYGAYLQGVLGRGEAKKNFSLPYIADSLLGLFVGLAEVELAIARGKYKEILRLKQSSPITLVDRLYPIGYESTLPGRFNIQLVTANVYDFLSHSSTQQYQIVTINAVEHHLNDYTEEGIENMAYLRTVLPNFVKQNGLVLARYNEAINLLDDRKTWIPLKGEYGAAFIRK